MPGASRRDRDGGLTAFWKVIAEDLVLIQHVGTAGRTLFEPGVPLAQIMSERSTSEPRPASVGRPEREELYPWRDTMRTL